VSVFDIISKATESTAPALRGRKLRLGVALKIMRIAGSTVRKIRQTATDDEVVTLKVTDDLAELLNGKLDALLRASGGSHPGLYVDRFILADTDGTQAPVVLLTLPGLAGCRQHRRLVKRLKDVT